MTRNLSILQWNICGFSSRSAILHAIVRSRSIDIVMLQETLSAEAVRFSGYHVYALPRSDGKRGLMTLVKATIPCSAIADAPHCGEDVESLAVEIQLAGGPLKLYNVYSRPHCSSLDISQVCASAAHDRVIIGGDFNTHHPILAPCRAPDAAGRHIANVLETFPEIALLNSAETRRTLVTTV